MKREKIRKKFQLQINLFHGDYPALADGNLCNGYLSGMMMKLKE